MIILRKFKSLLVNPGSCWGNIYEKVFGFGIHRISYSRLALPSTIVRRKEVVRVTIAKQRDCSFRIEVSIFQVQ